MGSKWFTGGVTAAAHGRIQLDFILDAVRYPPWIKRPASEANLRRTRERLEVIKHQIQLGTFYFADEFPDYVFSHGSAALGMSGCATTSSTITSPTVKPASSATTCESAIPDSVELLLMIEFRHSPHVPCHPYLAASNSPPMW